MSSQNLALAVSTTGKMKELLVAHKEGMAAMMPSTAGVDAGKIISTAIEAAGNNSALLSCTGLSVISAVKQACEFGLTFSRAFGQAHLVPYGKTAQLIIGYRGLLDLARRATGGEVAMDSDVVYSGDTFEVEKGTETRILHKINLTAPRQDDNIIGAYFVASYPDGRKIIEWMSRDEINSVRSRSKASKSGPWVSDFSAMCRKSVIRRGIKYLPLSAEKAKLLERAIEHDILTDGVTDTPSISTKEKAAVIEAELAGNDNVEDLSI